MIGSDLRHALRLLVRSPAFTLPALASLAVGIALNTTLFGVVNALLLKPLAGPSADTRVRIGRSMHADGSFRSVSLEEFEFLQRHAFSFAALVGHQIATVAVSVPDGLEFASGEIVSRNYFEVLHVRPQLGRGFDGPGTDERTIILSDRFWRSRFDADAAIVGQGLSINRQAFTVVGVAPPEFTGTFPGVATDVWLPSAGAGAPGTDPRAQDSLLVAGILKHGVTPAAARDELRALSSRLLEIDPRRDPARGFELADARGVHPALARGIRPFALGMQAIAGVVLLIVCANVAGLLLARAEARRGEFAVRFALGAPRRRIVRQLLVESLVLALAGGAGGLVLTYGALSAIDALAIVPGPTGAPAFLGLAIDRRVVAFTAAAAIATTIAVGLVPALQGTRIHPMPVLKDAQASPGRRRSRLRAALVVGQVSASMVLLAAAALLLRSVGNSTRIDVGFDPDRVVVASFELELLGYETEAAGRFYAGLLHRARGLPGVERAALAQFVPMAGRGSPLTIGRPQPTGPGGLRKDLGHEDQGPRTERTQDQGLGTRDQGPDGIRISAAYNRVSDQYFATIGQPLLAGRDFTPRDRAGAPPVAIVNETLAGRLWPGEDAIGRRIRILEGEDTGHDREVIGVVRDAKYASYGGTVGPFVFLPASEGGRTAQTLHLRTASAPGPLLEAVRALARQLDPGVAPRSGGAMRSAMSFALVPATIGGAVFGAGGAVALLLVAGGLYGLVSYSLEGRMREIGIRLALGAGRTSIFALLVGGTLRLTLMGGVLGLCVNAAAVRLLAGLLIGLDPIDAPTLAGVTTLLVAVALGAGYFAARRGLRLDPAAVLKYE